MHLSKISVNKLKWLFHSQEFQRSKLETLARVVLWEYHRLRDDTIDLRFDDSRISARCHDGIARMLYYFNGDIEREIFIFLDRYLRPGFTVIDVGANIGIYTIFAAKRVAPDGMVYSFEPNPEVVERLEENVGTDNVRIVRCALGEAPGAVRFYLSHDSAKGSTHSTGGDAKMIDVPCLSLDGFNEETMQGRTIDYLKIDAAGGDYQVLLGADRLFSTRKVRLVQVECLYDKNEIREFLLDHGYVVCRLSPAGDLIRFRHEEMRPEPSDGPVNLFAHPPQTFPPAESA